MDLASGVFGGRYESFLSRDTGQMKDGDGGWGMAIANVLRCSRSVHDIMMDGWG